MSTLTVAPRAMRRPQDIAAPVRLTGRGKAVVLVVAVVLALLALSWGRGAFVQASSTSDGPATAYISVEPGDTLWAIALRVAPQDDPRDTVDRILDLNALRSTQIQAGQRLVVPIS
jgi:LysM domain